MATLYDGLVSRDKIWRGASRIIVGDPDVVAAFPEKIEDIINLTTYVLAAGWSDVGPTTEDGVKVRREIATFDGIAVDQLKTKLDEGEPENTTMSVEMTLLHTDLNTLAMAWEGNAPEAIAGGGGVVAQHSMALDPPVAFTERHLGIIQRDEVTGLHRVFVFRKAIPQVEDEIGISSGEASELPFKLACKPDTTVDFGNGLFGMMFEEDAA